ncbi:MAG: RlmE family RNA methyltransferase [Candidatus Lokiarchaeota archaeon]|nr:RlmE family RNA methyltransferase [Candidatus Lokiarchaeota archaeon]
MSKRTEEHKQDSQYRQAKKQGYRARSAFKLFEIQKRFNIFKRTYYILDLGSAPGSWLQVSKKLATENIDKYKDGFYHRDHFRILGVDIKKISSIDDIHFIKMDFTLPEFFDQVKSFFNGPKIDLIISDASIKKSGNKFSDQINQIRLCNSTLRFLDLLKYKGNFVIKIFEGEDYKHFLNQLKKKFQNVKAFKPQTSYKKSNEVYLIGLRKK